MTTERDELLANLTATQARCTELLLETRAQRAEIARLKAKLELAHVVAMTSAARAAVAVECAEAMEEESNGTRAIIEMLRASLRRCEYPNPDTNIEKPIPTDDCHRLQAYQFRWRAPADDADELPEHARPYCGAV